MPTFLLANWDVIVFVVLMALHWLAWVSIEGKLNPAADGSDSGKREFAEKALGDAVRTGVSAVSILLPGTFVVAQIAIANKMPGLSMILEDLLRVACWFLASMLFGLISVYSLPMRGQKFVVTRDKFSAMIFGVQLFSLAVGLGKFVSSLFAIMSG